MRPPWRSTITGKLWGHLAPENKALVYGLLTSSPAHRPRRSPEMSKGGLGCSVLQTLTLWGSALP